MNHRISIIIPILNEAKNIGFLLNHISKTISPQNLAEIIVVDGGSSDNPKSITDNFTELPVQFINSKKGRAKQMNIGAKHASGDILYFLHVDSFPPEHFCEYIISEIKKGNNAGCFKMKFNSTHWWLKLAGWLTRFSWRICRGGDQSQFITKHLFDRLGGFDEQYLIYEDNDLISKLYAINDFVVIPHWITTSARRYQTNGVFKLQYHFWAIHLKKRFGASAEELHQYYLKNIT